MWCFWERMISHLLSWLWVFSGTCWIVCSASPGPSVSLDSCINLSLKSGGGGGKDVETPQKNQKWLFLLYVVTRNPTSEVLPCRSQQTVLRCVMCPSGFSTRTFSIFISDADSRIECSLSKLSDAADLLKGSTAIQGGLGRLKQWGHVNLLKFN